jgi:hypothetical protein
LSVFLCHGSALNLQFGVHAHMLTIGDNSWRRRWVVSSAASTLPAVDHA